MIELTVGARISVPLSDLPEDVAKALRAEFTHSNPVFHKAKALGYRPTEPPKIETWQEYDGANVLTLPRGGLRRVRTILEDAGLDWDEVDARCEGDLSIPPYTGDWVSGQRFPDPRRDPWEHQERIGQVVQERETALVLSGTGSGKTFALLMAIAEANLPALVVVWDKNLLKQWAEDCEALFGLDPDQLGHVQGKKRKLRSITLAMQQTLNRMDPRELVPLLSNFGFLALDEIQRAAAATYMGPIDLAPCRYRVGTSASAKRKDGKHFLIYDLLGEPAINVTRDELVDAGVVHDVAAVLVPTDFRADWYRQQVQRGGRPDFVKLVGEMSGDIDRTQLAARCVVERAAKLGRRALVLTHRVDHVLKLQSMLAALGVPSGLMLGGDDRAAEFAESKRRFLAGELAVGVGTYAALGVGHNLPNAEVGFAVTPVHSSKEYAGQVSGRVCRIADGKQGAELVALWDRGVFGDRPARNYSKWHTDSRVWGGPGAMIGGEQTVAEYLRYSPLQEPDDEAKRGASEVFTTAGRSRRG